MLTWAAGIGAVLCLIYYVIIVIYAGWGTSFCGIWLVGAAFLGAIALGARYCRKYPKKLPLWLPVSVMTLCVAAFVIFCVVEALVFLNAASSDTPDLDYVIVLGAKVEKEGISNSLKQRLDKAIEYSERNPDTVLVLSGGQGPDEPRSEASVMYEYLAYNGVPEDKMVMETISTSTVENIAYSRVLIEQLENDKVNSRERTAVSRIVAPGPYVEVEDKPLQIGVLTSNFHVFRAKEIAEKWGIPEIHGISSKSDPVLFLHLCVRECAAILKDKLMGNM